MRSADASSEVRAPADAAFGFLADLGNHWRLASRWIEVITLRPAAGVANSATVRLSGPLGISRTVQTRVDTAVAPRTIRGHGESGRTRADVCWTLDPLAAGTCVRVEVRLVRASWPDRLIWGAGGRRWLARRLLLTVTGLDALLDAHDRRAA